MALSSQSPRSDIRIDRTARARGPLGNLGARVGLVGGAFLVAGLGLIGIWKFGGGTTPRTAHAADTAAAQPAPSTPAQPRQIETGKPAAGGGTGGGTLVPAPSTTPNVNPAGENPRSPSAPTQPAPGSTPQPGTSRPLPADGAQTPAPLTPNTPAGSPGAAAPPPSPQEVALNAVRAKVDEAGRALAANKPLEARTLLNSALLESLLPAEERKALRSQIAVVNETLLFSPAVSKGDPLTDVYTIASGDSLVTLTRKQGLPVDWRFIQRINKITNPSSLRIGQKIKVVRQPFHAIVHKSDYRLDLYMGDPLPAGGAGGASGAGGSLAREMGPDGQDPSWTFIRSFPVGLGESNGTPEGAFVIRPKSKLTNPRWVNPRTSEVFEADNPKNPIGEHWLGLDGVDDSTRKFTGYGLHGTVDPSSIGKSMSMGCVRMNADDVALIYEVLIERVSTVRIVK